MLVMSHHYIDIELPSDISFQLKVCLAKASCVLMRCSRTKWCGLRNTDHRAIVKYNALGIMGRLYMTEPQFLAL